MFVAPPSFDRPIRDQAVDKGDDLKIKVPFSGTGPFDIKLKKGHKDVPENDRIKITPYDDYAIIQIKGMI